MDSLKAGFKWINSFFKSEWTLDDYPIKYAQWSDDADDPQSWSARIINWWALAGVGRSKSEAYKDLLETFAAARAERDSLPRPGTSVTIEFAPDDELKKNWGIASRIVSEILGFDPDGIFISDESSLWDFADADGVSKYQVQIRDLFEKDVSHIESGNLVEIAKFISDDS